MNPVIVQPDAAQVRKLTSFMRNAQVQLPRAMSTAVRRTVTTVRTQLQKEVMADLNVPSRKLYQKDNARRPIRQKLNGASKVVSSGEVVAGKDFDHNTDRLPLGRFDAKQLKRGVIDGPAGRGAGGRFTKAKRATLTKYRIDAHGGQKEVKGAFVRTMGSGYKGVFFYDPKAKRMRQLFGPSVGHVAQQLSGVRRLARRGASDILAKNIDQQMTRFLAKR